MPFVPIRALFTPILVGFLATWILQKGKGLNLDIWTKRAIIGAAVATATLLSLFIYSKPPGLP